jgi:predicted SAM-dependent methyltransferase
VGHFVRVGLAVWEGPQTAFELRERLGRLEGNAAQFSEFQRSVATVGQRQHELQGHHENLYRWFQQLSDALNGLREAVPTRDTVNDLAQGVRDHHASIEYLQGRVEFVRREMMFELRHGARPPRSEAETLEVQPKVIATEKLSAARASQLRLNLGCGHICLDGFLNVDRRELPGIDIVADAAGIPLEPGVVDEIFSAHMLEHFPEEQLRRELLPYWKSLLKPNGIFRAVVPDAEAMIREYAKGDMPYGDLREVTFGAQDYDGDFHFNMFTPAHLSSLLVEAGFSKVQVVEAARRNGKCFEFEILGVLA